MLITLVWILTSIAVATPNCDDSLESLNYYEAEILSAAKAQDFQKIAQPLSCILRMHSDQEGLARYMASSYLRPLLGGELTKGLKSDPRYNLIAKALEQLALKSADAAQNSFVTEFSKGDWRFYTLFCEQGDTSYCATFMPDEDKISSEPPLLAAASMLRLKQAYQTLSGDQRNLIAIRIKNLHKKIPTHDALKRRFIEQIYNDLFPSFGPLSLA